MSSSPKHRAARPWLQLSLRSLFGLTLVAAAFFGGYVVATRHAQRAHTAEQEARRSEPSSNRDLVLSFSVVRGDDGGAEVACLLFNAGERSLVVGANIDLGYGWEVSVGEDEFLLVEGDLNDSGRFFSESYVRRPPMPAKRRNASPRLFTANETIHRRERVPQQSFGDIRNGTLTLTAHLQLLEFDPATGTLEPRSLTISASRTFDEHGKPGEITTTYE